MNPNLEIKVPLSSFGHDIQNRFIQFVELSVVIDIYIDTSPDEEIYCQSYCYYMEIFFK
jgi:hypothetical protein